MRKQLTYTFIVAIASTLLTHANPGLATPPVAPEPQKSDIEALERSPGWIADAAFQRGDCKSLDSHIEKLTASGERDANGEFELYNATRALFRSFQIHPSDMDDVLTRKLESYERNCPDSSFGPVLRAIALHGWAWRARGNGYSFQVEPEGRQLFDERNKSAWQQIESAKVRSARLPVWYEQALWIGADADADRATLTKIFREGIAKFPNYYPLYYAYGRNFVPRWGGTYQALDSFVRASVKKHPEGDQLYARLYAYFDFQNGMNPDIFTESSVSWHRMRSGLELMMSTYPAGKHNQATLLAEACRAGDGAAYFKWRESVDVAEFWAVTPNGISLEICDARFRRST